MFKVRRRIPLAVATSAMVLAPQAPAALAQSPAQATPAPDALRQRAAGGDAAAQFELGIQLMERRDATSLAEARTWLRRAMDAGNVEAQNAYAGLVLRGAGGPRDEREGRRLLADAAARGSTGANITLGMAHLNGTGGYPRDARRAFSFMRAAAASPQSRDGFPQWQLGMMHLNGIGTPRNQQEAYRWVAQAAERGSVDGMISRAVMLATGEGVAADPAAARGWYERAARSRRGNWTHALRGLGGMLVVGQGGPADLPRGFGYLLAAYANGDRAAGEIIQRLRPQITPEIERQALAVATEWGGGAAGK